MKAQVIDLETTIRNKGLLSVGSFPGNPHYRGGTYKGVTYKPNRIVAVGWWNILTEDKPSSLTMPAVSSVTVTYNNDVLLVGHNIKFDILTLLYYNRDFLKNCKLWDTMIVEYLISGHEEKMISLNKLAAKYGLPQKPEKIKEYWNNGVQTEDIPEEELREYVEHDVEVTGKIYLEQVRQVEELGISHIVESQMNALKGIIEMEFNGMHVNIQGLHDEIIRVQAQYDELEEAISKYMKVFGIPDPNPGSDEQISAMLFGGTIKYEVAEKVLYEDGVPYRYKTGKKKGQIKTKKETKEHVIPEQIAFKHYRIETKKKGVYQVNENVLTHIQKNMQPGITQTFVTNILKYRELAKELTTYLKGYMKLVWPHDHCIHGNINMCITDTGRTSSSQPNQQNLSNA